MPDITLVNVDIPFVKGKLLTPSVPLGVLYLASHLLDKGVSVEVRDYQLAEVSHRYDIDRFMDWLEFDSPYVGFSCNTATLPLTLSAIARVKEKRPEVKTVIGGVAASLAAEELAINFPEIDYIITGEGEVSLYDLLSGERKPPKIIRSERILELDEFPFPAYQLIDISKYLTGMISSRGCPYRCCYCSIVPFRGGKWIRRSPGQVVAEMRMLKEKYSVIYLGLYDDLLLVDRSWFAELLREMISADLGFIWNCWGKVGYLDKELLELMVRSGCASLGFGVESGSDRVLREIGKDYGIKKAQEDIALASRYMNTRVSFIWGFPFESYREFQESLIAVAVELKRKNSDAAFFLL
ncbi:MAG: B12-binding domain-containing radical SAM protein, partial [bacterium]